MFCSTIYIMDAILNLRLAGSELDKQEVSEAAVARTHVKTSIALGSIWRLY